MIWGNFVVRFGSLLFVTPLILTRWDVSSISAWYLFSSVIALCSLLDLGFGPTFTRLISYGRVGDVRRKSLREIHGVADRVPDWCGLEEVYVTMRVVYGKLALLVFIVLLTLGTWSVAKTVGAIQDGEKAWLAWIIVVTTSSIQFFASRYNAVLMGMNLVAKTNRWGALTGLIALIMAIVALWLGADLLSLVVVYQLCQLFGAWLYRSLLYREFDSRFREFRGWTQSASIVGIAWPIAWRTGVGSVTSAGVQHFSAVLCAQILPVQELANLLFSLRLMSAISGFSQAPFYSKLPQLAGLQAARNSGEFARLSMHGLMWSLVVFATSSILAGLFGNSLLELIGANASMIDLRLWLVWSVIMLLERNHTMHISMVLTTNVMPFFLVQVFSGILQVVCLVWLLQYWGTWGFVFSQGLANAVALNWWPVYFSLSTFSPANRAGFMLRFIAALGVLFFGAVCSLFLR